MEIAAEIMESCRAGDRKAFRLLCDLYKDTVYSVELHFFCGHEPAASDITQQVLLKLMTAIGKFKGEAAFKVPRS